MYTTSIMSREFGLLSVTSLPIPEQSAECEMRNVGFDGDREPTVGALFAA